MIANMLLKSQVNNIKVYESKHYGKKIILFTLVDVVKQKNKEERKIMAENNIMYELLDLEYVCDQSEEEMCMSLSYDAYIDTYDYNDIY